MLETQYNWNFLKKCIFHSRDFSDLVVDTKYECTHSTVF